MRCPHVRTSGHSPAASSAVFLIARRGAPRRLQARAAVPSDEYGIQTARRTGIWVSDHLHSLPRSVKSLRARQSRLSSFFEYCHWS